MFKTVSIQLNKEQGAPLYRQLFAVLKSAIERGDLAQGERLPSVRKLIGTLGINNATVTHAYQLLLEENLVQSVPGSGYYVTYQSEPSSVFERPHITPQTCNLASTAPAPAMFPAGLFGDCIKEALDTDAADAFSYSETWGYYPLRETLAALCSEFYGIHTSPERLMIVSGAQQGLDVIARSTLKNADAVLMENPCYNGAKLVFESRGAQIYGVPLCAEGIDLAELERLLRLHRPKLLYVSPRYQTPTTICYTQSNQKQLLSLCRRHGCLVVEEDSVSDIHFGRQRALPLKAQDRSESVVYIKSFSKILMPGVRTGFVVVPQPLIALMTESKFTADVSSPGLFSRALNLFLRKGHFDRHLQTLIPFYRAAYQNALSALKALEPLGVGLHPPGGGLSFWLSIPKDVDHIALYHKLLVQDIVTAPGDLFYLAGKSHHLRLCYTAVPQEQFKDAAGKIAICIKSLRQPERGIVGPFIT